ncbi:MAG TPA: HNH endonuclease signature motif containing protein [Bacillota bacterium]|nr:HNH endonuclease signature motif containing protein [Bacillota bacterium]
MERPRFRFRAPKALAGPIKAKVIRRLIDNSKVVVRGGWRCWEWCGPIDKDGYGRICLSKKVSGRAAHRVAFVAFVRDLEDNETVDHRCLNRRCINPDHLIAMSQSENVADANRRRGGKQIKTVPF